MIRALAVALVLAVSLSACASDKIVLLPDAEGHTGAVAVLSDDGQERAVITDAYQTASVSSSSVSSSTQDAAAVSAEYGELLDGLPPEPQSFLLYFIRGTSDLIESSESVLPSIFAEIDRRPGAQVQVTGHTDTVGTQADNDALSKNRARVIRDWLIGKGMDAELISAVGRGERELLIETADEISEPANRRVQIIVR
ncbi:MAG: OmpA family protein [Alphaproteobacteria bacterium]